MSYKRTKIGDPLSPYLFILCAKRLSNLINVAKTKGEIRGVVVAVARGGTRITHLIFANDCHMSMFSLPKRVCKEISALMERF